MKIANLDVVISSGGPEYERLVVEIEQQCDSIATVSIETGEVLVEFKHRLSHFADTSFVSVGDLMKALEFARNELRKTYPDEAALSR